MPTLRLLAIIAVAATALSQSGLAAEREIAGNYAMKGTSLRPNSSVYEGNCVVKRNVQVFDVNCVNTGSGDKYQGKGLLSGDIFSLYLGEYLVVYRVEPDGRLVGNWAHALSDDFGEETLMPSKAN